MVSRGRHAVIVHFLDCFKERSLEVPELVNALKLIVLPVLEHTLKDVAVNADKMEQAKQVITEDVVHTIVMDVLETADDESSPAHADPLRIQLLPHGHAAHPQPPPTSSCDTARSSSSLVGTTSSPRTSAASSGRSSTSATFWRRTKLPRR